MVIEIINFDLLIAHMEHFLYMLLTQIALFFFVKSKNPVLVGNTVHLLKEHTKNKKNDV